MGEWRPVDDATSVEEATDALLAEGIGDGLPVVPPTAVRLERMLDGYATSAGAGDGPAAGAEEVLGLVPPLFGELTPAAAAYHAVLAGCRPAELPVVLAALRACLEPELNLLGVQTTTGTAAVAVLVHGPVVARLGLHTGANLLGPGNRVNASVGRAVALGLAGIGGARPGETDMATTGQPGRYTFCLPEPAPSSRLRSPFPSLAVRRGLGAMVDAVTVLAVGGTAEVLPRGGGATVPEILDPLADALAGAALAAGDTARMRECEQTVVLPPEIAHRLAGLGATADSVRDHLYARGNELLTERGFPDARVAASDDAVYLLVTGGAGIKMLHIPGWIGGSRAVTRSL
ncbi:hypothetical protein [Pseudonocardia sp. KRD291]|uniref:hypothetical protein n=1 Tax=Pseudonocardia sp. KRD291 TaxID=2792007 RepID=UPI001C4A33C2|nr:hypothetical protein [Pseudonocardia sp. KRD291]MBW0104281.1 hypothetical protein [Pseudonocardia sp. KRD291]